MRNHVFQELITFSRTPLARLPRASLRNWIAFVRGKRSMDGVPIPSKDLPIGPLLRPVMDQLEPARLQVAATELLTWLWDRSVAGNTTSLGIYDVEAFSLLLTRCPELDAVFVLQNARLDFRADVPEETRDALRLYVRSHYRPFVKK